MTKRRSCPGATIRNTESKLTSNGKCRGQSRYNSNIHYVQVYEELDELPQQGYNCFQIREILELSINEYKRKK